MSRLEKIAVINNEIEAMCLRGELQERGIPHLIGSHSDMAFDGLFQTQSGWGHIEAPPEYSSEIRQILDAIRQREPEHEDGPLEDDDDNGDAG